MTGGSHHSWPENACVGCSHYNLVANGKLVHCHCSALKEYCTILLLARGKIKIESTVSTEYVSFSYHHKLKKHELNIVNLGRV
jgi:hypothetical protein